MTVDLTDEERERIFTWATVYAIESGLLPDDTPLIKKLGGEIVDQGFTVRHA